MAAANSAVAPDTAVPPVRRVIFQPFSWTPNVPRFAPVVLPNGGRVAEFVGGVRDVASGVRDLLQIIERDAIDDGCSDGQGDAIPAMLGVQETANVTRLCIWALDRLANESAEMCDYVEAKTRKGTPNGI